MKSTYNIKLPRYNNVTLIVIYRDGIISEIKGINTLPEVAYAWIARLCPRKEADIEETQKKFGEKGASVIYTKQEKAKPASTHRQFVGIWFDFYKKRFDIKPKHTAVEGKAIKGIIKYLTGMTDTEEEAVAVWSNILQRWAELDTFTQSKTELIYINAKLNLIIQQLKPSSEYEGSRKI